MFEEFTIIDTETTNLSRSLAEICEVSTARFNGLDWITKTNFYGTKDPIPFEASAKNHISRSMLEGLPTFLENTEESLDILSYTATTYYIAHNSAYDEGVIKHAFVRNNLVLDKKFICTMRLADRLYGNQITMKNLSYLRYFLDLDVPDSIGSHRAEDDVLVTASLFDRIVVDAIEANLVDPQNLATQLYELCWQPKTITVFPFGKHKGQTLGEVPTAYFLWAIDNMDSFNENHDFYDYDLVEAVRCELERRL